MQQRVFNFSAGPAVLPLEVLQQAQTEMLALPGVGMSVLEISHRSAPFEAILAEAQAGIRQLLHLPENYQVLFLQGGASLQFSMLPMNFLRGRKKALYLDSGAWASKAIQEAQREGTVDVVWSGKAEGYRQMPEMSSLPLDPEAAYVHITSNETIEGIAWQQDPDTGNLPLICDASSDIFSRPLEVEKYACIYAGAQKNIGPAGVTLVILRDDLLTTASQDLPTMLDYRTHVKNNSLYNTPPVFAIYLVNLVIRWLLEQGGLPAAYQRNQHKASLLYEVIDQSGGFYQGHAHPEHRSLMNVTFRLPSPELESAFAKAAEAEQMFQLKGHRSVGGIRASIYNACPLEAVEKLAELMQRFKTQNA